MAAADGHLVIIVIQLLSLEKLARISSPLCNSDGPNEQHLSLGSISKQVDNINWITDSNP